MNQFYLATILLVLSNIFMTFTMKKFIQTYSLFLFFLVYSVGCIQNPNDEFSSVTYRSRQTIGCIREIPLAEMTNGALLTWAYDKGHLELYINLDTFCSASLTDSIKIAGDILTIVLEDTVSQPALCACIFREVFYFRNEGYEKVSIQCYFKPQGTDEIKPVINQTLLLTDL